MSSAVAELDAVLQSMLQLKSPGVTGSKISTLTSLCTANVKDESIIVQKIFVHFKKTPSTHKLGVLYVVDSVARQWVDQAKKSGQQVSPSAPDGTFAAGVNRVTELLPSLMNDIISVAPNDQKPKIKKLLEIWERSNTFPTDMLATFKTSIDAPRDAQSTTPTNSPPPSFIPLGQLPDTSASASLSTPMASQPHDTSAILEALKSLSSQQNLGAQTASMPVATTNSLSNLLGMPNAAPSTFSPPPVNHGQIAPLAPPNVNPFAALLGGMNSTPQPPLPSAAGNPLASFMPPPLPSSSTPAPMLNQDAQQTLQLVQMMAAQGIPSDQWAAAIQVINMQKQMQTGNGNLPIPPPLPANSAFGQAPSRDMDTYTRSPQGAGRRRSRSPPSYRDGRDDKTDYRQRSPQRSRRRSISPVTQSLPPPGEKRIEFDPNLPKDTIKVLSRTLFVGGVTSSDNHLRSLFAKYGAVQTCIVNVDKRHAFVKMIHRSDAEQARKGMEEYRDGNTQLRTKWGVGFGPRDCSDYQTGVSIIPASRLTDADRKWLVSAEYGGTGGQPILPNMVVEEPDIEIGAGVSSKAMSRRIATDQGGRRGPQSSNKDNERPPRRNDRRDEGGNSNPNMMPLPQTNGMNMPMGMMNFPMMPTGMPMMPPGFPFSFPQQGGQNGNQNNDGNERRE